MSMIHLGIVEDENIMLRSIQECFEPTRDVEVTRAAGSMEEFLADFTERSPMNMLLLDINLPGMSGIQGIPRIRAVKPEIDIIMLTNHDDSDNIFRALQLGAVGYISKKKVNLSILRDAIHTVHRGGSYMSPGIARKVMSHFGSIPVTAAPSNAENLLTDRQLEIVKGLTDGLSYRAIADRHDIGLETVRDHIKKIYRKLQVNSKTELFIRMMEGE